MNHVVILLAGKGSRFDKKIDKSLVKIHDKYMFQYILETLADNKNINSITMVVSKENKDEFAKILTFFKLHKTIKLIVGDENFRIVSLDMALNVIKPKDDDVVITLDGDRPFVTNKLVQESIDLAKNLGFSSASLPVYDSVINFTSYQDRSTLTLLQTPQSFVYKYFNKEYNKNGSDLISCMEWKLKAENLYHGDLKNFKITTQDDLEFAKKIILK